ncbi:hypothetical protein, partial [Bradyrhizobium sp.]|uniref:hypothetical protein n=1 Tax=Bradyrhizobium sp. TaxID=376 RepID=UPI0025C03B98
LRNMALSHAVPSLSRAVPSGLGLALSWFAAPGSCSHQYDRSESGERVFRSFRLFVDPVRLTTGSGLAA